MQWDVAREMEAEFGKSITLRTPERAPKAERVTHAAAFSRSAL